MILLSGAVKVFDMQPERPPAIAVEKVSPRMEVEEEDVEVDASEEVMQ